MIKCYGTGRVEDIKTGNKDGKVWAIVRVSWQEYDGKDENGKFKYRNEYASLMMRDIPAERLVKAVKEGKVINFEGKPRAGKPYTPKNGGDAKSSLEVVIDNRTGDWDFPPREAGESSGKQSETSEEEEDEPATKSAPKKEDTEDPDVKSHGDPFEDAFPQ